MRIRRGLILLFTLSLFSCKKDPVATESGYPEAIGDILLTKCATSGCHDNTGYLFSSELNLSSMKTLLQGGHNGAVAVPYAAIQSPLFQFINTYSDLGLQSSPTMPLNGDALSKEEVQIFRNWILAGCPDKNGQIPFASNPESRKKIYISNQGCDIVSVIDAETKMTMRYVQVGHDPNTIELPHMIQTTLDGKYWYTCFVNGTYLQKYDASTDQLVGEANIGVGSWNVVRISDDNTTGYVSDLSSNGKLAIVDLTTMTVKQIIADPGLLNNPHGMALTSSGDTVYITSQYGNMIYRYIPKAASLEKISLQKGQAPVTLPFLLDPHEIIFNKDESRYFVTCQASNEVRVMDKKTDTLVAVIPIGKYPQEMIWNKEKSLLFIACQEDPDQVNSFYRGSVYCIDPNTLTVARVIYAYLFQPHGLAVDYDRNLLYVASRNADPNGPAPHHISSCGGRNGYYTIIDLNTYQIVAEAFELSSDPYSVVYRP